MAIATDLVGIWITASPHNLRSIVKEFVISHVLANDQIRRHVVARVIINMMHMRAWRQRLTKRTLSNEDVLIDTARSRSLWMMWSRCLNVSSLHANSTPTPIKESTGNTNGINQANGMSSSVNGSTAGGGGGGAVLGFGARTRMPPINFPWNETFGSV